MKKKYEKPEAALIRISANLLLFQSGNETMDPDEQDPAIELPPIPL